MSDLFGPGKSDKELIAEGDELLADYEKTHADYLKGINSFDLLTIIMSSEFFYELQEASTMFQIFASVLEPGKLQDKLNAMSSRLEEMITELETAVTSKTAELKAEQESNLSEQI